MVPAWVFSAAKSLGESVLSLLAPCDFRLTGAI